MSRVPAEPAVREQLLVLNGKIVMRGTDKSIWGSAVIPILLEEESITIGDPRIEYRRIVKEANILPRLATDEQKKIYYEFAYDVRGRLFPHSYTLPPPPGLEIPPEEQPTDPPTIEDGEREELPSLKLEPQGPRFPIPHRKDEEHPEPARTLTKEEQDIFADKLDNSLRFKRVVGLMAGAYLECHVGPDESFSSGSILSRARDSVSGKSHASTNYYQLYIALTYRKALCKLADRYTVLVANPPGKILCADWDPAAARSLGDQHARFASLWKQIYNMELFPPPSPAGEQGTRWTKPPKYLAAALVFSKVDDAGIAEKLDWLYAVKTKVLDGISRGLLTRHPSVAKKREEVGAKLGLSLRDPFPDLASPGSSSSSTVTPGSYQRGDGVRTDISETAPAPAPTTTPPIPPAPAGAGRGDISERTTVPTPTIANRPATPTPTGVERGDISEPTTSAPTTTPTRTTTPTPTSPSTTSPYPRTGVNRGDISEQTTPLATNATPPRASTPTPPDSIEQDALAESEALAVLRGIHVPPQA